MKAAITRSGSIALLLSMAATAPAFAHHPMGGQTPQTFMSGLLSGLGHPIIGLDHLAAVVGVGILAGLAARGIVPVLAFSAAVIAGVVVHLAGIGLPAGEFLVGLSTLVIGGLVIVRSKLSPALAVALFALAGLVHGTPWARRSSVPNPRRSPPISRACSWSSRRSRSRPMP